MTYKISKENCCSLWFSVAHPPLTQQLKKSALQQVFTQPSYFGIWVMKISRCRAFSCFAAAQLGLCLKNLRCVFQHQYEFHLYGDFWPHPCVNKPQSLALITALTLSNDCHCCLTVNWKIRLKFRYSVWFCCGSSWIKHSTSRSYWLLYQPFHYRKLFAQWWNCFDS